VLALSACGNGEAQQAAEPVKTQVRISGSGTAMPLVQKLAEAYERSHSDVRFVFEDGTNSGGAITGVQDGALDLAVVNRELKPEESTDGVSYVPLARDAVAFAVGPGVELDDISTADVRRIYRGDIVDWKRLGLAAGPVVVLDRDVDESARELVLVPVMDGQAVRARTTELAKASEMADALAGTPDAFGYTAAAYLQAKGIEGVKLLSLDGTAASADAVAAGTYPWFLTLALVHGPGDSEALTNFIAFASGSSAAPTLEAFGYAPVEG
jgi:phosphate transport system substrate-binding protein